MEIDFGYSFAAPHTMTFSRPSAGEKYIADISPDRLHFLYSFGSLREVAPLVWDAPKINLETELVLYEDGRHLAFDSWSRHDSGAPCLLATAQGSVRCSLTGLATRIGVVVAIAVENTSAVRHTFSMKFSSLRGWVIANKGWIDGRHNNVLLTMNNGRADRIIAFAEGADDYPMFRHGIMSEASAPMPDSFVKEQSNSMMFMTALLDVPPESRRRFHLVMPFEAYFKEYESLRHSDFDRLIEEALEEWTQWLGRGCTVKTGDADFDRCLRACIADVFVMREPVPNHACGIAPGTNAYRSMNSCEGLEAEILIDRLGYVNEAAADLPNYFAGQNEDGCWAYEGGWEHEMWIAIYKKCHAAWEHFQITRDWDFLRRIYPRMKRSAWFNANARKGTQGAKEAFERGLMPRGMGDCGMMNNGDYYGVFYPMNCLAVAADKITLKAAEMLGYDDDAKKLRDICNEAEEALRKSMRENAVRENDFEWIPAIAHAATTSLFGCLFAYYPGGILDKGDPLIIGTLRHVMEDKISDGGLPVGTGWLPDGIWAAMALDNFSSVYLRMGERQKAASFLYPVLNHATPLVTWCEERGKERNSQTKTGDMQHLWTPLSVVVYTLDALLYEDDNAIHLLAGVPDAWLDNGREIKVDGLQTHYGKCSFTAWRQDDEVRYDIAFEHQPDKPVVLDF